MPAAAPTLRLTHSQVNQKTVGAGQTPLMLACKAGAADCVRLLLEAGADATLFDEAGSRTCLHYAGARAGQARALARSLLLVRMALRWELRTGGHAGLPSSGPDRYPCRRSQLAALFGWAEAIDALLEDDSRLTTSAAHAAAFGSGGGGGGGQQRQLLRDAVVADSQGHHRYVDGRAGFGLAPLHLAAFQGHLAATKALLRWGASLTGEPAGAGRRSRRS